MKTCKHCERRALAHGLCSTHEMRRRSKRSMAAPVKKQRSYTDRMVAMTRELASSVGIRATARELDIPRATVWAWARGDRR